MYANTDEICISTYTHVQDLRTVKKNKGIS